MIGGFAQAVAVLLAIAPAGSELHTDYFRFETRGGDDAMARALARDADDVLKEVSATLGIDRRSQPPIHVVVVHGQEAFAQALAGAGGMAEWAAGVAAPRAGRIVLRVDAQTRFEIRDVLRHEMSHVVLGRATGFRPLPLWLVEGVAVHQAGERLRERWEKTLTASLAGDLPWMSSLAASFPEGVSRIDLAYAQSTAFVGYLIQRWGWASIRTLLVTVREGVPFPVAFERTYGSPLTDVELAWRTRVEDEASWIPVLTREPLLWILVTFLFLAAFVQVRRRNRRRLTVAPSPDDEFA